MSGDVIMKQGMMESQCDLRNRILNYKGRAAIHDQN